LHFYISVIVAVNWQCR